MGYILIINDERKEGARAQRSNLWGLPPKIHWWWGVRKINLLNMQQYRPPQLLQSWIWREGKDQI